jgi:hypothetical protein
VRALITDRRTRPRRPPPTYRAIDVSIPPHVERTFGGRHFKVAARDIPYVTMPAYVAMLAPRPPRVAFSRCGGYELRVGALVLRPYQVNDVPAVIWFRPTQCLGSELAHCHTPYAAPSDWRAVLAVACAFARSTRGIIWRIDTATGLGHDFYAP